LGATAPLQRPWKTSNPRDFAGFHRACDGRANTLVIVRTREGSIFGGFAVPAWNSSEGGTWKDDPTELSFIFVLKNTFGDPPTRFPKKGPARAIWCRSDYAPTFGGDSGGEIRLWNGPGLPYVNLRGGYVDKLGRGTAAFVSRGTGEQFFDMDSYEVWAAAGLPTACA
jgi:hypothetical protein